MQVLQVLLSGVVVSAPAASRVLCAWSALDSDGVSSPLLVMVLLHLHRSLVVLNHPTVPWPIAVLAILRRLLSQCSLCPKRPTYRQVHPDILPLASVRGRLLLRGKEW